MRPEYEATWRDSRGMSPLHAAVECGHIDFIRWLCEYEIRVSREGGAPAAGDDQRLICVPFLPTGDEAHIPRANAFHLACIYNVPDAIEAILVCHPAFKKLRLASRMPAGAGAGRGREDVETLASSASRMRLGVAPAPAATPEPPKFMSQLNAGARPDARATPCVWRGMGGASAQAAAR